MRATISFRFGLPLLVAFALSGCSAGPGPADSGSFDAGLEPDAGLGPDAGTDSGSSDAGELRIRFLGADGGETASQLYALPFAVEVSGAPAGGVVALSSRFQGYIGSALFTADRFGTVRTDRDAPVGGGYSGVDPDGLLWSAEGSTVGGGFDVTFTARTEADAGASSTLRRPGMGSGFDITRGTAAGLPYARFSRADGGLQPTLVMLGGSECDLNWGRYYAAWLSTMGFDAVALDYCRQGIIRDVALERLMAAIGEVAALPNVDPNRLGVVGISRGGELALQMAAVDPRLKAVVALVPSPYRWGDTGNGSGYAWTLADAGLPNVPDSPISPATEPLPGGVTGYRLTPTFLDAIDRARGAQLSAATIAFSSSPASLLLIGGADDGIWPSCRMSEDAWALLTDAGHTATHPHDARHCLPEAGHAVGPPGWSEVEGYSMPLSATEALVFGGTAAGRGRGNRAADSVMRAFLRATMSQ